METERDRGRLEAVVIATGPTMIRLVTRAGRRITFPTARWETAWTLVQGAPAEPQQCRHCRQTAFFRHTVGGETVWVCEDHLPSGARAYFPGDSPGPPGLGVTCPRCESPDVVVHPKLVALANDRTTTQSTCQACSCCWSTLVGRGLGDDGTILANDLTRMIESDQTIVEAWLGFVAYRNLCRAIGMGDLAHLHGMPIQSKPSLSDMLAFVFSSKDADRAKGTTTAERAPPFGVHFPDRTVLSGSRYRRQSPPGPRRETVHCLVLSSENQHHVAYRLERPDLEQPAVTLPVAQFHLYWALHVPLTEAPMAWTTWRHVETGQLVQVMPGTSTQVSNGQVSYFTPEGRREATPVVTFYRLYVELPTPPELHIWHRDGLLFVVDRAEGNVTVHPYSIHEDARANGRREMSSAAFYEQYDPLVFADELIVHHPLEAVVRKDAHWISKSDPSLSAFIVDVGRVERHRVDYVRFNNDAGFHAMELLRFLSEFQLTPSEIPCAIGETWVGLAPPYRQGLVIDVNAIYGRVKLRWDTDWETTVSCDELTSLFRKLDVRSYWEILDSEDDT